MSPSDLPLNTSRSWFEGSSSLLEAIVQSSDDAIITKNLDGIITSWNPAAEAILGYAPDEIIGQSILTLIPQSLRDEEPEIIRKIRAGERIAHFETRRLTRSGTEINVSLTISPVRNQQGEVVGVSKILRDISGQKHLDHVRLRLAAIVESSDDAIVSKDLNGVVTSWNQAAERIFGYTEQEMIGSSITRLIPLELLSEEQTILSKLQAGERIEHYETIRLTRSGERLEVSLTISPLKDASGKIVGASKVLRNIQERKRMERSLLQAEKIAATGRMAASIAHEINNPLESVMNLIYVARTNASDTDMVVNLLTTAEEELVRVAHIAKQTLGYYRELAAAVRVALPDLITDALKIYGPKLNAAGVEIHTNFTSTREIFLRKGEMMQVISNLITNAMYAMPAGGTLTASVEDAVEDGSEGLLMVIEDTGEGIPSYRIPKIFEPFFTTRSATGTGIGLWLAKQFVEGHKGALSVQSSVLSATHGTRMSIFLPFKNPYGQ